MEQIKNNLIIDSSNARILYEIQCKGSITGAAIEMIAVQRGLIKEEGIIPRKKEFEHKMKAGIWSYIQADDTYWQQDISIKSIEFSSSGIEVLLKADFIEIKEAQKKVIVYLCDFSNKSKDDELRCQYREVSYMVHKIAKEIWRNYTIQFSVIHYDHHFGYLDEDWVFDSYRMSIIKIPCPRLKIRIHEAINIIAGSIRTNINYSDVAIDYEDLPDDTQLAIDGLNFIRTYLYVFRERLKDAKENSKWNKRRLFNYVKNDKYLSSLSDDLRLFSNEFTSWYDSLHHQTLDSKNQGDRLLIR